MRSTAPLQLPQAPLLQVCVPVLHVPQLRVSPDKQVTHSPLPLQRGVAPEQVLVV
jgi:hypothetical protein